MHHTYDVATRNGFRHQIEQRKRIHDQIVQQALDVSGDKILSHEEGYSEIGIQNISVAYSDLDADDVSDDVLLVLENVYHWYRPLGEVNGASTKISDRYEIEFIDPVGLVDLSGSDLETAVSEHLIVDFVNNRITDDGEYRADSVTLADVDSYKMFLTGDLGMEVSDSFNGVGVRLTVDGVGSSISTRPSLDI